MRPASYFRSPLILFAGSSSPVVPVARAVLRQLGSAVVVRKDHRLPLAPCAAVIAMAVGSFTAMTFLTKESFLDEIRKQYVVRGARQRPDEIKCFTGTFSARYAACHLRISICLHQRVFSGALLIETSSRSTGLGSYRSKHREARLSSRVRVSLHLLARRPVRRILSDFVYTLVDPRIDFETREV